MPGDDKGPDLIRVKDSSSNSKADTFEIEPKAVGKEGNTQTVRVGRELEIPQFDDPTNAPQADGLIIWVTGDGSDPQGLYQFDGSSFVQTGGGAPTDASYVTTQAEAGLSNETVYGESLDVEDLGTQGTDGQVPTANASGGIDMESLSAGSALPWERDGNSPFVATNTPSATYTFATNWDEVLLFFVNDFFGFDQMQVNGDTSANYDHRDSSDTRTTGSNQWPIPNSRETNGIRLRVDNDANVIRQYVFSTNVNTNQPVAGGNNNFSAPLTQFTLLNSGGFNRSAEVEVFGFNYPL